MGIQSHQRPLDESLSLHFTLPIIFENSLTILIGLVFSQLISTISSSALAAIGMANTVMSVVFSAFSMVITGAAVLVSRQIGAGEGRDAAETIEQSMLMTLVFTALITVLCWVLAVPLLRLLMPTAEDKLFQEAVRYYRILMLSLPMYVLHGVLSGVCRSMGDSKNPMWIALIMNIAQIAFAYLFITVFKWEEVGAGLAYVGCRLIAVGLMLLVLLRNHKFFVLHLRNLFHPHFAAFGRILRIGIPVSVESVFVQVGYMLGNSMSIALGTFESGVYQIMNTLNNFAGLPQGICSTVGMTAAGHLIGANKAQQARRAGRGVWLAGILSTIALGVVLILGGKPLSGIYSTDPAAISMSAGLMWILLVMDIAGVSINAIDSQLRAGGDVKYVMIVTLSAVWGIRLPLTYLFCFYWDMGVFGIFLANTISLYFRAVMGFVRHCGNKWLTKKV